MKYFENEEETRRILETDYIDRVGHSPMRDGKEIRAFFDEINDAIAEERCRVCGGVKRFGICQDCGSDM